MPEVSITGLTRITDPKPNKGGSTVLAWFDCEANGIALHGCAFVRTARRGLTVWPPKIEGREDSRRCISIADEQLRKAMVDRAQETYRTLGGTDGEWMPVDPEEKERRAANFTAAARRIQEREQSPDAEGQREGAGPMGLHRTVTRLDASEADTGLQRFIAGAS
jgi:hypothetical protein